DSEQADQTAPTTELPINLVPLSFAKTRYDVLARVDIRHEYYEHGEDGRCFDFAIAPTVDTAILLDSLGLIFRYDGAGFAVLYDWYRQASLKRYLQMQGGKVNSSDRSIQYWTRLSFVLTLKNPLFVNVTDMPMRVNPLNQNFYFTNQEAH